MPKLAEATEPDTTRPTADEESDVCPICNGHAEGTTDCFACNGTGKKGSEIVPDPATPANPDLGAEALEWKARVKAATLEVQGLHSDFFLKNEAAKSAKKRYETAAEDLQTLILREPEPMPLFDKDAEGDGVPPLDDSESWKLEPISALKLPLGVLEKLSEANIDSLGDLSRWQAKKKLTDVPGIGRGNADKIEEALIAYWEENPVGESD